MKESSSNSLESDKKQEFSEQGHGDAPWIVNSSSDGPDVSAPDLDMVVFRIYFKAVARNV